MAAKPRTISSTIESRDPEEPSALIQTPRSSEEQVFKIQESRKLGVTSSVFLILNKMIGTGSQSNSFRALVAGEQDPRNNLLRSFLHAIGHFCLNRLGGIISDALGHR